MSPGPTDWETSLCRLCCRGDQWHTTYAIVIHCRCVCLRSPADWRFFYAREMNLFSYVPVLKCLLAKHNIVNVCICVCHCKREHRQNAYALHHYATIINHLHDGLLLGKSAFVEFSYLCVQELKCYSLERDMQTPSNTIGLYNRQDAQKMKNIPAYRL